MSVWPNPSQAPSVINPVLPRLDKVAIRRPISWLLNLEHLWGATALFLNPVSNLERKKPRGKK